MKTRVLPVLVFSVFLTILSYGNEMLDRMDRSMALMRNTRSGCETMIRTLEGRLGKMTNSYELYWQLSLAYCFYGDMWVSNRNEKPRYFEKAKNYAEKALLIIPGGIDATYWLGVSYALWSSESAVIQSYLYAQKVLETMSTVISNRPDYFNGMPWAVRARVYNALPGVGNKERAYRDINKALKYGKDYRLVWMHYVIMLYEDNRLLEAKKAAQHALSLPPDKDSPLEESAYNRILTNHLDKIEKKLLKKH